MTRVCICGGGSLGLVMAGVLAGQEDCEVCVYTSHPEQWHRDIYATDMTGRIYSGTLSSVSNEASMVREADVVLLCLPGFLIEKTLRDIRPYLSTQAVGSIVSSTGFFLFAHQLLPVDTPLFGFQRVPFIARTSEYGHTAQLLGYKSQLYMAIENIPSSFVRLWSRWLNTPVGILSSFWEAALTNSNPLLHPARLYGMWSRWERGMVYDAQSYFYAEWDDLSSEIYIRMDREFQQLTHSVGVHIPDVLTYYESVDAPSLSAKLRSIAAFQSILSPMKQVPTGWIPDLESRYFTEDFPFGLLLVKQLAEQRGIETPTIDKVVTWYRQLMKQ